MYVRSRDNWLRHRTALFDRYTVPSVRAQEMNNLYWIVYLDPGSPDWLLSYMERLRAEGVLAPVLRTTVGGDELRGDIRRTTGRSGGRLLTTNLDNDDGLAVDFSSRLQRAAGMVTGRTALYVPHGLILSENRLFLHKDRHNAFCSVVEDIDDAHTCWMDWHNRLDRHMPVYELDGGPGWLQVVHGNNVTNRIRGHRVGPDGYRPQFAEGLLDDVEKPGFLAGILDRAAHTPYRRVRDAGRSSLRSLAVGLVGKQGLDNAKARFAKLRD